MRIRIEEEKKKNSLIISGKDIESFERIDKISEVILLGKKGNIRRLIINES